jgi:hypothetical protein
MQAKILTPKRKNEEILCFMSFVGDLKRYYLTFFISKTGSFVIKKTLVWIRIRIGSGFINSLDLGPYPDARNAWIRTSVADPGFGIRCLFDP